MTLVRGTDHLESARLMLRRMTLDDLPFFTRIHGLPEVAQHLYPGGRPRSPEETARWMLRSGWFGREEAPAGLALTYECELGYTLDPAAWGQGFASEAARCVRDYAGDVR